MLAVNTAFVSVVQFAKSSVTSFAVSVEPVIDVILPASKFVKPGNPVMVMFWSFVTFVPNLILPSLLVETVITPDAPNVVMPERSISLPSTVEVRLR